MAESSGNTNIWSAAISAGSGLISGLIGTIVSGVAAKKQRKLAKKLQDEQIASNEQLNQAEMDFAREQSDIAYDRSTASNQINELMKAGLSEQQAKQAVLGMAGAAYTPGDPSLVSSMAGVDPSLQMDAYANQANAINSGVSSGLDSVSQLLQGSIIGDGGAIGTMMTADIQSRVMEHYNELPSSARTLHGFMSYANSGIAPGWCRDLINSKLWKSAITSQPGMRALKSFFQSSYDLATGDAHLDGLVLENKRSKVQINLDTIELNQETLNYLRSATEWAYDQPNMAIYSRAKYENAVNMINKLSLENDFLSDPNYRKQAVVRACTDMDNQVLYVTALKYIYEQKTDWLSHKDNAAMMAIFDAFGAAGVTKTEAGSMLAAIEASGVPLTENVRSFVSSFKSLVPNVPEVRKVFIETKEEAQEVIESMKPKISKAIEQLKSAGKGVGGHFKQTYETLEYLDGPASKDMPWYVRFRLYQEVFWSLGLSGMDEANSYRTE